jgi:hypothetical protein
MTGQGKRPREPAFRLGPGQAVEAMDMAHEAPLEMATTLAAIQELRADMARNGERQKEDRQKIQKQMAEQHRQLTERADKELERSELADLNRQADILELQTEATENKARAAEQVTKQAAKDLERDNTHREAMERGQKEIMQMMSRMMMEARTGAAPEAANAEMEVEPGTGAGGTMAAQEDPTRDKTGGAIP